MRKSRIHKSWDHKRKRENIAPMRFTKKPKILVMPLLDEWYNSICRKLPEEKQRD